MKTLLCILVLLLGTASMRGQSADPLDGLWQGYDGELRHVSKEVIDLADAFPQDKFAWRPGPGVRSTSEVLMHIALSNFYLLSITGPKMPKELEADDAEKAITSKTEVLRWLKESFAAVAAAHAHLKAGEGLRKVTVAERSATVDGMYLRILVHDNEHLGQLVAYARVNGIVPPWSRAETPPATK